MLLVKNLETPRLTIRSWRNSDKDFTLSLWGDKENGKYMSDPILENMDEAYLKCVDEMEDNPEGYYLLAELKEDGSPVGTLMQGRLSLYFNRNMKAAEFLLNFSNNTLCQSSVTVI